MTNSTLAEIAVIRSGQCGIEERSPSIGWVQPIGNPGPGPKTLVGAARYDDNQ